jgi:hypothetical protein
MIEQEVREELLVQHEEQMLVVREQIARSRATIERVDRLLERTRPKVREPQP